MRWNFFELRNIGIKILEKSRIVHNFGCLDDLKQNNIVFCHLFNKNDLHISNTCYLDNFLHVRLRHDFGNLGIPCFDIRVIFAAQGAKSLTDGQKST